MDIGQYFLIALGLSFLGSLPIGLISLAIVQRTIQNGRKSGIMIALGATVMEFVYTFVALVSLDFFATNTSINHYIKLGATIVFFGMGIYFLFKKSDELRTENIAYNYFDFFRGVVVGTMNMLIVPFWIFLALWLKSNGLVFDDYFNIALFSLGAAIGALLAFFLYILLSEYVASRSKEINHYTNKVVGVLFLGFGGFSALAVGSFVDQT